MTSEFAKVVILLGRLTIVRQTTKKHPNILICVRLYWNLWETKDVLGVPLWTKNNKDVLNSLIMSEKLVSRLESVGEIFFVYFPPDTLFSSNIIFLKHMKGFILFTISTSFYAFATLCCFRVNFCHGDSKPESFRLRSFLKTLFACFLRRFFAKYYTISKATPTCIFWEVFAVFKF